MRTLEDLESYIASSGYLHEQVASGTWIVRDPDVRGERIVVHAEADFVVFRLKVLTLDGVKDRAGLFEHLLTLNASDLSHGAYALVDGAVVLTNAHRLATLDLEEFRGTVDEFTLAVATHRDELSRFCA